MNNNSVNLEKLAGVITKSYGPKSIANFQEYYLSGEITDPEDYTDWFDTIRHADENDVIKIYINSCGGNLYTAIQFMRVMSECKGTIIASAEGACMSAATIIFLCADQWEVSPHSVFMFHNYSSGTVGKGGEMFSQLVHEKKWTERIFTNVYSHFLSDAEIKSIIEDKDIWMDGEEVVKRMNRLAELAEAELAAKAAKKASSRKPATKATSARAPKVSKIEESDGSDV